MKKSLICSLCWGIGVILVAAAGLQAHGPKKVELSFTRAESVLTVTVQHPVGDPGDHFIKRIRVWVDGELAEDRSYEKQSGNLNQRDTFALGEVKPGTEIKVKATCNKIGAGSATLTVSGDPEETG